MLLPLLLKAMMMSYLLIWLHLKPENGTWYQLMGD